MAKARPAIFRPKSMSVTGLGNPKDQMGDYLPATVLPESGSTPSPTEKPPAKKSGKGLAPIAKNLKQLAPKPNTPAKRTMRGDFIKKLNSEKNPDKRRLIKHALKGRMFQ